MGDGLVIRCGLASVYQEDIDVSLSGGALTVDGECTGEPEASDYYARGRYYDRFRWGLKRPEGIDGSRISASFESGLLGVTVRGGVDRQEPESMRIEHRS